MSVRDRRLPLLTAGLLAALTTAACGGNTGTGTGTGAAAGQEAADTITVAATDDACDIVTGELAAGTHQFQVTNSGNQVTEFYVYAEGDRVMGEVDVVRPGGEDAARSAAVGLGRRAGQRNAARTGTR